MKHHVTCMFDSLTRQKHCILVCNSTPYQQIKSQQSLNYADLTCEQLLHMFPDVCRLITSLFLLVLLEIYTLCFISLASNICI